MKMQLRQSIIGITLSLILSLAPCQSDGSYQDALAKITLRAEMSQSDVILITYRGHPIYMFGGKKRYEPMELRSVTKSFASLAIGMLVQERKICSIDTPVYCFYPEWKQGQKQKITLRQLLNHTSGLMADCENDVYEAPDSIKFALAADVVNEPGTHFIYNNKAINLLSGIVEKVSGVSLHDYLKSRLFQPLSIYSDTWLSDRAGNPFAMSHLTMNALDLAKVGLLISNGGCLAGKRLIDMGWIEASLQPSQSCNPFYGQLWWLDYATLNIWWDDKLIKDYIKEGVSTQYIGVLKRLHGQVFTFSGQISYGNFYSQCASELACHFGDQESVYRFLAEVEGLGLPMARWDEGELHSFSARGFLGQQLVIMPQEKLVAVRLARSCGQTGCKIDTFADFESLLEDLAREIQACPRTVEYINPEAT